MAASMNRPAADAVRLHPYTPAWRRLQVTAQAKVNEISAQRHTDSYGNVHHTYCVTFGFDSTDGPVALKARVNKSQYDRLQGADTVNVRYALDNPRVALLEGEWVD